MKFYHRKIIEVEKLSLTLNAVFPHFGFCLYYIIIIYSIDL